jgi:hypothetical protein
MVSRLRTALEAGARITGADASFYVHEIYEATLMGRGLVYDVAHEAAPLTYNVSPFSIYHPDVIRANPGFLVRNDLSSGDQ